MRRFTLLLAFYLVAGLVWVSSGGLQAKSPPAPEAFRYAHAQRDCAPWDGLGWNVTLTNRPMPPSAKGEPKAPFPLYSASVWRNPLPLDTWTVLSGNKGNVMYCPAESRCEVLKGRIRFTRTSPTQIEGELRVTRPQETSPEKPAVERSFLFTAPVLNIQQVCG